MAVVPAPATAPPATRPLLQPIAGAAPPARRRRRSGTTRHLSGHSPQPPPSAASGRSVDKGDHPPRRHRQDHGAAMAGAAGDEGLSGAGIDLSRLQAELASRLQAELASRQAGSSSMTVCRSRFLSAAGHERGEQVGLLRDPVGAEPTAPGYHPASDKRETRRQLLVLSIQRVVRVYKPALSSCG